MAFGTAYGVILNDRLELDGLAAAFAAPPYRVPPRAPVLYVKPRGCWALDGAPVVLPPEVPRVTVAATVALLFDGDGRPSRGRLALEVSEPHADYYRPAVRERCRDTFLPLGPAGPLPDDLGGAIVTTLNGEEVHRWSLDRLARPIARLVAEVTAFMTLGKGDLLMVGLPGDAPRAGAGDMIEARTPGFAPVRAAVVAEAMA